MPRTGRKRLPKVHEVRRAPTMPGIVRTWLLRYPETDVEPRPLPTYDPLGAFPWSPLKWLGFIAVLVGIRLSTRKRNGIR
jgi:hypothetical protein